MFYAVVTGASDGIGKEYAIQVNGFAYIYCPLDKSPSQWLHATGVINGL